MNKLRVAVIGVGALGQHHARILSGFDDVDLVAVVDSREAQGRQIADRHQTHWFSGPEQVQDLIDAAVIAVPTVVHAQVAEPLIQAGIPLLIEKPLAASLSDAERLHQLATEKGVILQAGHVERFNPAFQLLQQRCGQPLYIRTQRFSPYTFRSTDIGVVHDLMIHDIDLAMSLVGDQISEVDAFGAVTIGPHEDLASARLRTAGGVILDLNVSRMNPGVERSIQVWCPNGYFHADLQTRTVSLWRPAAAFAADPTLVHQIAAAAANPLSLKDQVFGKWLQHDQQQASSADSLTAELRDFVDSILERRSPLVSSTVALRAMEVADRVLSGMQLWNFQSPADTVELPRAA